MKLVDRFSPLPGHRKLAGVLVGAQDGRGQDAPLYVQTEHEVLVAVNGVSALKFTCTPDHLVQLVVGRLFTEGMVTGIDDIEELVVSEGGSRIAVSLRDQAALGDSTAPLVEDVGTCSVDFRRVSGSADRLGGLPRVQPIEWRTDDVFALARAFRDDSPMHRRTYGAHSCYLAIGRDIRYCCEDLGRHNAFDKVVGCALMDGVDLAACTVFTSGRVPTDMALKAIRAGIPVMVSKAVPTDTAVELARAHGLTLICSAYPDSFVVAVGNVTRKNVTRK